MDHRPFQEMVEYMSRDPKTAFNSILKGARQYNASDIHLIAGLPPAVRVAGEILVVSNWEPLARDELNAMVDAVLTPLQRERLDRERELCVSFFHEGYGRIRLSLYHRVGVTEMAIRLCNLEVKSAEELMLPKAVSEFAEHTAGLILVTGPTGMGKTTTMNFIIDLINSTRRAKIVTIEDPVEFEHPHRKAIVTQIEVGTDTLSFARCLRHVLRLDPDVIAIGEMRDTDTIETALTAAETGHLVLATLHTPSAVQTAERIVSSFDGSRQTQVGFQLATTLLGVVAQRLIPSVDKKSRILATEMMMANDAVRNMIREGNFHQLHNAVTSGRAQGMHTLEHSLADLYQRGLITLDRAMANANLPSHLQGLLKE
ncbi:type IV pilus twitching motility protein PilT [Planctomycetota bacterium]